MDVLGATGKAPEEALLTAKTMMSIAGALWVFFGLTLFTLLKDVVLGERTASLNPGVGPWILKVVTGFFLVNFGTIAAVQSFGVWLIVQEHTHWVRPLWAGNLTALCAYVYMAWSTLGALKATFEPANAAPVAR